MTSYKTLFIAVLDRCIALGRCTVMLILAKIQSPIARGRMVWIKIIEWAIQ